MSWLKRQVVMLPTNEASSIYKHDKEGLSFSITGKYLKTNCIQPQHLYIISNEEIKEGDWCINKNKDTLYQLKGGSVTKDTKNDWDKIIATTDTKLACTCIHCEYKRGNRGICKKCSKESISLAYIPESFIKKFVESQGSITEVLVEYEAVFPKFGIDIEYAPKLRYNNNILIMSII